VINAMFDAFYESKVLTTEQLLNSLEQTAPLSRTMSEDVERLRQWAEGRARSATSPSDSGADGPRQLEL